MTRETKMHESAYRHCEHRSMTSHLGSIESSAKTPTPTTRSMPPSPSPTPHCWKTLPPPLPPLLRTRRQRQRVDSREYSRMRHARDVVEISSSHLSKISTQHGSTYTIPSVQQETLPVPDETTSTKPRVHVLHTRILKEDFAAQQLCTSNERHTHSIKN